MHARAAAESQFQEGSAGRRTQCWTDIAKLQSGSSGFKSVIFATEAGDRACILWSRDGDVEVALSVDWRTEPDREARIRAFFSGRGVEPSQDYLVQRGATKLTSPPVVNPAA